jgi:hypothetical protein
MTALSHLLPPLPGFTALSLTYVPWPVWSGSTTTPIRFVAMPKKAAVRLWHRARDFDRSTHQPGHHGGPVGHTTLAVLHALIFDFLNHRTGRLDPSYAAIAAKAGVCVRTVATALQRLKALGILNWVRRCAESGPTAGVFRRERLTGSVTSRATRCSVRFCCHSQPASILVRRRSMHDQNRAVRQGDDLLRDAAKQQAGQPSVPAAAESDQVGLRGACARQDLLRRITHKDIGRNAPCALCRCPVAGPDKPLAH